MADNKHKKRLWIQNLLNRYRMVVINEKTFNEEFSFRLSRLNIIIASILVIAFIFIGAIFLVAYTPLKEFIPGYTSTKLRKEAIMNSFLLDSLSSEFQKQHQFINAMKSALTGEISLDEQSFKHLNQSNPEILNPNNSLVKADSLLRLEVIQEDKYNVLPNPEGNVKFMLFSPVSGIISQPFNNETKHFAVDIALAKDVPIKSVATGTVILADWTADTGYVIVIKHDYGLLSVYKHNSAIEKFQGDLVAAGEVIAYAGYRRISTGYHLHLNCGLMAIQRSN